MGGASVSSLRGTSMILWDGNPPPNNDNNDGALAFVVLMMARG